MIIGLYFVAGFVFLLVGADLLVRGGSRLAINFGISPLVVGLTIVAYGTSAPELAVTVLANVNDNADIAVGNIIGSNITNLLLVLGLSALVTPLVTPQSLLFRSGLLVVLLSFGMWGLALDGSISQLEGIGLLLGSILYTILVIWTGKQHTPEEDPATREILSEVAEIAEIAPKQKATLSAVLWSFFLIVSGIVILAGSSSLLIDSAEKIALAFKVDELFIGLTLVALGTSLPEGATAVVAAFKNERHIVIGNIIGSNIFNILLILGTTGAIDPHGVLISPGAMRVDLPIMCLITTITWLLFFTGSQITRIEAITLLILYGLYFCYLLIEAKYPDFLPIYTTSCLYAFGPVLGAYLLYNIYSHHQGSKNA
ncbi:MAG: calcium/sodium antiporter [Pirellulaceae bacterium]|nr:calcium/sodium antiporter [Pirellulaceae bacterium]